jgi:hypothetical protein
MASVTGEKTVIRDGVKEDLKEAGAIARRLAARYDESKKAINFFEARLETDKVWFEASVSLDDKPMLEGGKLLSFANKDGKRRIYVVWSDNFRAAIDCDRETRELIVKKLPDLAKAIRSAAEVEFARVFVEEILEKSSNENTPPAEGSPEP